MKVERLKDSDYAIHYPSFDDLVKDVPKTTANKARYAELCASDRRIGGAGWFGPGVDTPNGFVAKVKQGWPELTARVKAKAELLRFKPDTLPPSLTSAMRRRRVRADAGSELDIHRVYQGQLDTAWSDTRRELHHVRRRAAQIYVAISCHSGRSAAESEWRAAVVYRICELFQRSGFAVEITVGSTGTNVYRDGPAKTHVSYTAKSSGMPMDLNRVALQCVNGWNRVYCFAAWLCNDRGHESTYGMGFADDRAVPPMVQERVSKGDVLVHVRADIYSEYEAKEVVLRAQKILEAEAK